MKYPKCAISQAATSQVCPSRRVRPPACSTHGARPQCSLRRLRGSNLTFGKLSLGKLHIWEVATWENTIEKLPLGKNLFGKYLTSSNRLVSRYHWFSCTFDINLVQLTQNRWISCTIDANRWFPHRIDSKTSVPLYNRLNTVGSLVQSTQKHWFPCTIDSKTLVPLYN